MSLEGFESLELVREGDLLRIRLNEPQRANALSPRMVGELTRLYSRPLLDDGIRATVLEGAGKHFSAGADLAHLRSLLGAGPEENRADSEKLRGLFEAVLWQECLTVALVQGACVAGGCGLATAHDFVVAAESARFLYSEARIGFVPALVATFLPLRLRGSDIRELLLNPEFIDAPRALELGLVDRVVTGEGLGSAGEELVAEILERASSQSIALTKRVLLDVLGRPLEEALDRAAEVNAASRATADCEHGITTFLETKSTPNWREAR